MAWIRKSKNGRGYHVVWRDPDGRERSRTFRRKEDARDWKSSIEVDLARGSYPGPVARPDAARRVLAGLSGGLAPPGTRRPASGTG